MFRFYFPADDGAHIPNSLVDFQAWFEAQARGSALLGPAAWIVQTFIRLQARGLPCELVSQWPKSGIVISHRDHLPESWEQRSELFVVCCLADRAYPHACANLHILQNPYQAVRLGPFLYVPHWPQPGLKPRDPLRGDRFENLAFFGEIDNLTPELRGPEFASWCRQEGMNFSIPSRDAWADYGSVDAVIAVRRFTKEWVAFDKPATKLFNAWLAGVVPILGREAAYAAEGRLGENCVVVPDLAALKARLIALRQGFESVSKMLAAGEKAAKLRSHEAVTDHWCRALTIRIQPAADRRSRLGFRIPGFADFSVRLKAGLAWRGHLLKHRQPPAALLRGASKSADRVPGST